MERRRQAVEGSRAGDRALVRQEVLPLAVNVPAALLPNGKFLVKLYGAKGGGRELVGEYDLTVRR